MGTEMNNQFEFETHFFNSDTKRLEYINPNGVTCRYCENTIVQGRGDNCFVKLYGVQNRITLIVYNSVKYNELPVEISRCNKCRTLSEQANEKSLNYVVGIIFVMFILSGILFKFTGIFFGIFIAIFIGALGRPAFRDMILKKDGIVNEYEGAKRESIVQDFIIEGWSLDVPTAR
jgi:hypothetical protein